MFSMTAVQDAIEFACHAQACAPPPVGAGGSRKGTGKASRATRAADVATRGRALRKYIAAKKSGDTKAMARHADEYRRARNRVQDNIRKDVTGRSSTGAPDYGSTRQTRAARAVRGLRAQAAEIQSAVNAKTGARSS
jgi:hypothetical protein